jgi:hypothetical protein
MTIPEEGVTFASSYGHDRVGIGYPLTVTPAPENGVHLALTLFGFTAADAELSEYEARRLGDLLATHYGLYDEDYRERRAMDAGTTAVLPAVVGAPRVPEVGDWATVTAQTPYSANLYPGQRVQVLDRWTDERGAVAEVLREGTSAHWTVNATEHLTLAAPPIDYEPEPPAPEPDLAAFMRGEIEAPFDRSPDAGDTASAVGAKATTAAPTASSEIPARFRPVFEYVDEILAARRAELEPNTPEETK